jgi:hypothetical protein
VAIVKKGSMLEGLRGRIGDLVFREVRGQTVVSHRPSGRNEVVRSPQRERALTRFQQAVLFAREARHRHSYRSLSRVLRAHSPYHVALQDFLSEPVIERIDASGVGPSGGELVIAVSERVAVRSVRIKIAGRPSKILPAANDPTVEQAEGMEPAPQGEGVRFPIPAAVFFRRLTRQDKPEPPRQGTLAIHPIDQAAAQGPEGPEPGETETAGGATPLEIHATRHMGIRQKAEGGIEGRTAKGAHTEIWRVTVPRPGEVEVIATDYAGNRAVRVFKAGLPAGDRE